MHFYEILRQFADSWVLLALTCIFLGVILYAFRPGSRPAQHEAATVIFRHEDAPAKKGPKP
ncbi:MAG: cbb3-type cytochrome c oxidase subunit 3 [Paracoccaceae bacterium]